MNPKNEEKIVGLGLVSGGLDSLTACLILKLQGIEVVGLNFKSPFCLCDKSLSHSECGLNLFYDKLDIKINTLAKGDDYLEIVKNPKFGYGKNLNPCIDCRIYILKKAKDYMRKFNAHFIFTGEVLNQRPKSQNLKALKIVESEAELEGILLRPLSAKLLKPTILEKQGLIDRSKLLAIWGRSRKIQLELARKHGLLENYYACGGCLLTEQSFANRMRDYMDHCQEKELKMTDVNILKYGRHFRFKSAKIIIGRNEIENNILLELKNPEDTIMEAKSVVGPITIVQGSIDNDVLQFAAKMTLRYSDFEGIEGQICFSKKSSKMSNILTVKKEKDEVLKTYIL